MQESVEGMGLSAELPENDRGEVAIGAETAQKHVEKYIIGGYSVSLCVRMPETVAERKKYKSMSVFCIAKLESDRHECSQRNYYILSEM